MDLPKVGLDTSGASRLSIHVLLPFHHNAIFSPARGPSIPDIRTGGGGSAPCGPDADRGWGVRGHADVRMAAENGPQNRSNGLKTAENRPRNDRKRALIGPKIGSFRQPRTFCS